MSLITPCRIWRTITPRPPENVLRRTPVTPYQLDTLAGLFWRKHQRQRRKIVDARQIETAIARPPDQLFLVDRIGAVRPDGHVNPARNLFRPFVEAQSPDGVLLRRHFTRFFDLAFQILNLDGNAEARIGLDPYIWVSP